jgi:Integrase zinc binding domain
MHCEFPSVREAHCQSVGHRAYGPMPVEIKEYVAWTTMSKDAKGFVKNCPHCVTKIPGDKFTPSLGTQIHDSKFNEIQNSILGYQETGSSSAYCLPRMTRTAFYDLCRVVP